jgi:hypothetical protein
MNNISHLFASWWTGGCSQSPRVWKMVPLCLLWCLWRLRNARCFEGFEWSLEELKLFFFFFLFTWTAAYLVPLVINFPEFLVLFSFSTWAFSCIRLVY